jgi:ATP-dependent DNA ligase
MLCSRLENPARLADRGSVAEPKLDGQRAQVHIRDGRSVACATAALGVTCYAMPVWLGYEKQRWLMDTAVLDGEACAGDGHEGIQAVFEGARKDRS